jgi:hypothetical protein
MGLVEKAALVRNLAPPLDPLLASQLVDEFVSLERRFIQRDWEPAELDGGQFCEVLARILYHQDSGILNLNKPYEDCCNYITNDQVPHQIDPRRDALHHVAVLKTIYKLRSQRGAVHITANYGPNQMDAKFIIEGVRWLMNDALRVFWQGDRHLVAKAIREILQFDVPCVGQFEEVILVQRTDLSPDEEVLVLLHFAGETGFTRTQLGKYVKAAAPRITEALQKLTSPQSRQVIQLGNGAYRLTDLGSKFIRDKLADKLVIQ